MSHPNPSHDESNVHKHDADERGFKFTKKAKYNPKSKVLENAKTHPSGMKSHLRKMVEATEKFKRNTK